MHLNHFGLTNAQCGRCALPPPTCTRGKPRVDNGRVIGGIIHVMNSRCHWKGVHDAYGSRKVLYNRVGRCAAKGVWVDVFYALASAG